MSILKYSNTIIYLNFLMQKVDTSCLVQNYINIQPHTNDHACDDLYIT